MKRYLHVNVLSVVGFPDTTNNGVTHTHPNNLVVECERGNLTEESVKQFGYVVLKLETKGNGYKCYVPANNSGKYFMAGGNFVYSSDSRFREINQYPVPVHDRAE